VCENSVSDGLGMTKYSNHYGALGPGGQSQFALRRLDGSTVTKFTMFDHQVISHIEFGDLHFNF